MLADKISEHDDSSLWIAHFQPEYIFMYHFQFFQFEDPFVSLKATLSVFSYIILKLMVQPSTFFSPEVLLILTVQ